MGQSVTLRTIVIVLVVLLILVLLVGVLGAVPLGGGTAPVSVPSPQ
jgi:hypothetical protein